MGEAEVETGNVNVLEVEVEGVRECEELLEAAGGVGELGEEGSVLIRDVLEGGGGEAPAEDSLNPVVKDGENVRVL